MQDQTDSSFEHEPREAVNCQTTSVDAIAAFGVVHIESRGQGGQLLGRASAMWNE
jgi:hypothetical protein